MKPMKNGYGNARSRIWVADYRKELIMGIDWYNEDEEDLNLQYADDDRTLTMAQLEKILISEYGSGKYDRTSGCYHYGGKWFSVDNILESVSGCI